MISGDPLGGIIAVCFALFVALLGGFMVFYSPKKNLHKKKSSNINLQKLTKHVQTKHRKI